MNAKNVVPRSHKFHSLLTEYVTGDKFAEIRATLSERKYTVSGTNVPYRIISHWDDLKILPFGVVADEGWRKFNFPEVIWLRVVQRLRSFGVSLERIAYANVQIMDWEPAKELYPFFEFYLCQAWLSEKDVYVALWSDGSSDLATSEELEKMKLINKSVDVLLVSLKSLLREVGVKSVVNPDMLFSLTESELNVLEEIRLGKSSEIVISLDEDRKVRQISGKTITQGRIQPKVISDLIQQKGFYGSITVQVEDGVEKTLEIIKKKRDK